jgi:hypothetical protein
MKNVLVRQILLVAFLAIVSASARADAVTDWNAVFETVARNPVPAPGTQTRMGAILHAAIFEAVNGIARKYTPLHVTAPAPDGARPEAAAVQAAYVVLSSLFPAKQALLDQQLETSLSQIAGYQGSSESIANGRAWGGYVAQQILAWRANDGFSQVLTYTQPTTAGYWRFANAGSPAAGLSLTVTAPFALTDLPSFDPGPPYGSSDRTVAMATAAYAADVNEIQARGGVVSAVRTPAQTDLALLIAAVDPVDLNGLLRRLISPKCTLVENARAFALLNFAGADATIITLRSKYKYGLWRPIQAIRNADLDGNAATTADPAWSPVLPTPPHPEYTSGHSCIFTAMLGVAIALLGDETPFTLTTSAPGAPGLTAAFPRFSDLASTTVEARIDIGFHFRTACEIGQEQGYRVAHQIVCNVLLPVTH